MNSGNDYYHHEDHSQPGHLEDPMENFYPFQHQNVSTFMSFDDQLPEFEDTILTDQMMGGPSEQAFQPRSLPGHGHQENHDFQNAHLASTQFSSFSQPQQQYTTQPQPAIDEEDILDGLDNVGSLPGPDHTPWPRHNPTSLIIPDRHLPSRGLMQPPSTPYQQISYPEPFDDSGYRTQSQIHDDALSHQGHESAYSYDLDRSYNYQGTYIETETAASEISMSQPAQSSQSSPRVVCSRCPRDFGNNSALKKHEATHDRRFICDVLGCPKSVTGDGFPNNNDLQRHRGDKHQLGLTDVYFCNICGKFNSRTDNFTDHLKRAHQIEKNSDGSKECCNRSRRLWSDLTPAEKAKAAKEKKQGDNPATGSLKGKKRSSIGGPAVERKASGKRSRIDPDERISQIDQYSGPVAASTPLEIPSASSQDATLQFGGQFGMPSATSVPFLFNQGHDFEGEPSSSRPHYPLPPQPQQLQLSPAAISPIYGETPFHPQLQLHHPPGRQFGPRRPPIYRRGRRGSTPASSQPQNRVVHLSYADALQTRHEDEVTSDIQSTLLLLQKQKQKQEVGPIASLQTQQSVPRLGQQAFSESRPVALPKYVSRYSPEETSSSHTGSVGGRENIAGSFMCDVAGCKAGPFPQQSKLNKHRLRHSRPYRCVMDDCRDNKGGSGGTGTNASSSTSINIAESDAHNGLSWALNGSKHDQERHEMSCHLKKGQVVDSYRCTGEHKHEGQDCQMYLPRSIYPSLNAWREGYMYHLHKCGVVDHEAIDQVARAYIPANYNGRYWCGFCNAIVNCDDGLKASDFTSEANIRHLAEVQQRPPPAVKVMLEDKDSGANVFERQFSALKINLDQRRTHVQAHLQHETEDWEMGNWKYLNGLGRRKLELDIERKAQHLQLQEQRIRHSRRNRRSGVGRPAEDHVGQWYGPS